MIKALVEWRYEEAVQLCYHGVSAAGTRQGTHFVQTAPEHLLLGLSQLSDAAAFLATAFCKVGTVGGDESGASGVQQSRALTLLHRHDYVSET